MRLSRRSRSFEQSALPARMGARGFTLMELLLAIVVSAVVLAAINGIFFGAMRLRNRAAENLDLSLPLQNALSVIRRDLMGIQRPGGTFAGTLNSSATVTGENETDTGTEIYTNTGVLVDDLPWGDIQRISYALRAPTNRVATSDGRDLVRIVNRNLLPPVQDEPVEQRLLSDVQLLEFSFYDGQSWRTTWNSTNETTTLPRAIKVSLTMAPPRARSGVPPPTTRDRIVHQVLVPIFLGPVTNSTTATATAGGGA